VLEELDQSMLVRILTEPKDALVKQYQRLFDMEDVRIEFSAEALEAIAQQAVQRGTGARGLRTITENILMKVMYEAPSIDHLHKVIIDETVINDGAEPLLVFDSHGQGKKKRKSTQGA